jgi:hypothetical protein
MADTGEVATDTAAPLLLDKRGGNTMSRLRFLCAALAVALLAPACKKTVEGETKAWARNTQVIQELSALHPGFAAPLKEQQDKAQALLDGAKAISDPEASAKKMAEANSALVGGFVRTLRDVDDKTRRVREKGITATSVAVDVSDRMAARQASEDAQRVMVAVEDRMRQGAPNVIGANVVLRRMDDDLTAAERSLDLVIKRARDKQEAAKAAAKAAGAAGAAGAGAAGAAGAGGVAAQPAAAGWKCSYCNFSNATSATKCRNCGAARP